MRLIGRRKKRGRLLGVDIGSASVKVLELSESNGSHWVESYALEAMPPNAVVDGNISDIGGVGEALKRVRARSGSRTRRAVTAVAETSVIARTIALDASLSDQGILAHIAADADRYVPYPLDEVSMDFEVRGLSEEHPERAEVLLVACRRSDVDRLCAVLRGAGLEPAVVEPEAQAVERVFELLEPRFDRQVGEVVMAMANVGAMATNLWVLVDGRVVFSRAQALGHRRIADAIQERRSLSDQGAPGAAREGHPTLDLDESVARPFIEETTRHLSRSLRFFCTSTHYSDVDRILLIGGAAAVRGLPEALQNALQAPTVLSDPFAGMALSSRVDAAKLAADAPALALCCGLAMRSAR